MCLLLPTFLFYFSFFLLFSPPFLSFLTFPFITILIYIFLSLLFLYFPLNRYNNRNICFPPNCKKNNKKRNIFLLAKPLYILMKQVRDFHRKLEEIVHYQCFKLHTQCERVQRQTLRKEGFSFSKELLLELWPLFKTKYRDMSGYVRKPGCAQGLTPSSLQRFEVIKVLNAAVQREFTEITGNMDNILYESIQVCKSLVK